MLQLHVFIQQCNTGRNKLPAGSMFLEKRQSDPVHIPGVGNVT